MTLPIQRNAKSHIKMFANPDMLVVHLGMRTSVIPLLPGTFLKSMQEVKNVPNATTKANVLDNIYLV